MTADNTVNLKDDRNRISVMRQLAALQTMSEKELHEKWRDMYGSEPPQFKRFFLQKRLAYRIQELFYGGLSENTKTVLDQLAEDDPVAQFRCKGNSSSRMLNEAGRIMPGTRFIRHWNSKTYEIIARAKGFEYNGKIYRSLTAVAYEITGAKWNGWVFFGLKAHH